ncbi:Serine/threonine-protein kinase [Pelomyxa schiedti]|nr:Serine/threonine-protein kinase [Pelomyxa schiedti]
MYWGHRWDTYKAVDCGVVQPEFDADMSSSRGGSAKHGPSMPPDAPNTVLWWDWYGPSDGDDTLECFYDVEWNPRIAGAESDPRDFAALDIAPVLPESLYTTAFVSGLQPEGRGGGLVPNVTTQYEVGVNCVDTFTISVAFKFWFTCGHYVNSSDGAASYFEFIHYEEYSFDIRWSCFRPGCSSYCEEHGTCLYDWGACICDEGWSGIDCQIQWNYNHTLCPRQTLNVTYNVPAVMYGYTGWLADLLAFTAPAHPRPEAKDWVYLLTWNTLGNTSDPRISTGMNSSGVLPSFLPPGKYIMAAYSDNYGWLIFENFYVLAYDQCGYPEQDVLCGGGSTNNCFNTTGNGICVNEECMCNGGYYWFDCSIGCSAWTRITDKKGVITSDASVVDPEDGQKMHYLSNNNCRWFLDMSGFRIDFIRFTFTFIDVSDFVSFYYSDSAGTYGDMYAQLTTVSAGNLEPIEMKATHVIVELYADPQNTRHGFILEYEAMRRPITAIGVGVVIVVCAIVAILGLTATSVALFFLVKRRRRIARAARMAPAEKMERMMTKEEIQSALSTNKESDQMLEKMGLGIDKDKLTFGLSESDACPVSQKLEDEVTLKNHTDKSIHFCFKVPDISHVCELNATPGVGILPAKKELIVHIEFMLKYTTHFEHPIKVEFLQPSHGEQVVASMWLSIQVEGAVSESIDPEEVMLNPTPLAAGGFGSVFGGVYRSQMVAVKIPKHQEAFRISQINDFNEECEMMKRIRHPNVVNFIGASHVPGKLCICIELVEKGSLASFLESSAEISFALTLKFAINSAEAMSYLHKNNVLFRDLKCSNILVISTALNAPVNCKLTDFGTARNVENVHLVKKYTLGIGTPAYMAPEILSIKPYNFKVDVFSFGMCLWEMWMREELWSGVRFWDIPCKIEQGIRPQFDSECPQEYSELTKKCWEPNAEDRPEFHEIRDTLTHIHNNSTKQQLHTTTKPTKVKPEAPATTTTTTTKKGDTHSHTKPQPDAKAFNVATGKDQQRGNQLAMDRLLLLLGHVILAMMMIPSQRGTQAAECEGLDVYAYVHWDGEWSLVKVVDCGVVQPEFDADMSGASARMPDMEANIPYTSGLWTWYPPSDVSDDMQCYFRTDWKLRIAAASETVGDQDFFWSSASVSDLPESGEVPPVGEMMLFEVDMYCWDNFVSSVAFQFWFTCGHYVNSTDGTSPPYFENVLFEEYSFDLRWDCHRTGCSNYCDKHGTCVYYWAQCQCDEGWSGINCQIQWNYNHTLCPSQALNVTYYLPPGMYGDSGAIAELLASVSPGPNRAGVIEWVFPIHWNTKKPAEDDPRVITGVNGSGVFPSFLPPGIYRMRVGSYKVGWAALLENFYVLDYDQCGYPEQDVLCGGGSTNNCFNTTSNGICVNEKCSCNGGYYWYDCSRGCSAWEIITDKQGVITSDALVVDPEDGKMMHYLNNNVCRWFLDMSGFRIDSIRFTFTFIEVSDCISFYYSDSSGSYGDMYVKVTQSGHRRDVVEMQATHVIVEFDPDYQNSLHGFILEYEAMRRPIKPLGVGLVGLVCAIVAILGLTATSVALFFLVKRRRRIARAARMAPAEKMERMMTKEEIQSALATSTRQESDQMLEKMGLGIDKDKLTFGLSESDAFPVSQKLEDEVILENSSDKSIHFRFSVPDVPHVCELNATPGVGILPAQKALRVRIEFMLKYTTHFEHPVKIEFLRHGDQVVASTWLSIQVEGAVSESIDPDEVMLNPTPLAAGGFGSVFGGVYRSQMVAVKIPKHQEVFKDAEIAEFSEECEMMKRIRHPNVVNFIGASHVPGKLCICIELVEKGSLASFLESPAEISFALTLKFAINSAEAMSYLHKNNVLFRDLKCSNILVISTALNAPVNCKLTDFGTARNVENVHLVKKYTLGIGTPAYMAPEILSIKPYNFKVDVFSFGMCLWEMWMRDELWSGVRFWDIPRQIEQGIRPQFDSECPQEYSELTKKCWEPNAEDRPEFHEIRDTLTHIHNNSTKKQLHTTTKTKSVKPETPATTTALTTTTAKATKKGDTHSHTKPQPDAKAFNVATGKDQQRLHHHLARKPKTPSNHTPQSHTDKSQNQT